MKTQKARKVQVGISLTLAALEMADAVTAALHHPHRSALIEKLIRSAAEKHLHPGDQSQEIHGGRHA